MNVIDYVGWVMMLVIGFFIGLLIATITDLFALGLWPVAALLLLVLVLVLLWESLAQILTFDFLERLFGIKKTEAEKKADQKDRRYSRYSFAGGLLIGFVAAQIWAPSEIMGAL